MCAIFSRVLMLMGSPFFCDYDAEMELLQVAKEELNKEQVEREGESAHHFLVVKTKCSQPFKTQTQRPLKQMQLFSKHENIFS